MKPVLCHSYLSWGLPWRDWIGNCAGIYWHSKLREEIERLNKTHPKILNIEYIRWIFPGALSWEKTHKFVWFISRLLRRKLCPQLPGTTKRRSKSSEIIHCTLLGIINHEVLNYLCLKNHAGNSGFEWG